MGDARRKRLLAMANQGCTMAEADAMILAFGTKKRDVGRRGMLMNRIVKLPEPKTRRATIQPPRRSRIGVR